MTVGFRIKEENHMRLSFVSIILLTVTLGDLFPPCVLSQTQNSNAKNRRPWLMSIYAGKTSNHVAQRFENAMIDQGFDVTIPNVLFGGTVEHPWTYSYNLAWMAGIHYAFKPRFTVGLVIGNSKFGETFGARDEFLIMFIEYSTITVSPLFSMNAADLIRFGIGPSLFLAKAKKTSLPESSETHLKLGIVFDVGLTIPRRSRVFGELKFQYRKTGKIKVGPLQEDFFDNSATFSSEISYDHWLVGLGLGVRLAWDEVR